MSVNEINQQLYASYSKWKLSLNLSEEEIQLLSPPILLQANDNYLSARRKVMIFGQETMGWQWNSKLREDYPLYPEDWTFSDIDSFSDFVDNDDSVLALVWGYAQFSASEHQPINRRGPFFQALRCISEGPPNECLHNNLVKVDFDSGSFLNSVPEVRLRVLDSQCTIIHEELEILKPDVCIFFVGPNYDWILQRIFRDIQIRRMEDSPIVVNEPAIARLVHERLPKHSYRTYHPGYLRRRKKTEDVMKFLKKAMAD